MGVLQSNQKGLDWFDVPTNDKIVCYDPRYEDIICSQKQSKLMISETKNNLFVWGLSETNNLVLESAEQINAPRNMMVSRYFDQNGETLLWIEKYVICCYNIQYKVFHQWDIEQWLTSKYNDDKTKAYIPSKQLINLGNGNALFMVGRASKDNKTRTYDIVQMNIYEKKRS